MIQGVDSSGFHPTLAQVRAAFGQGIRVWGMYLPGPYIYSGTTKADFDTLKAGGMITLAFWSGAADPAQMKALGIAWGVDHICLDVENRIRGDGPWVQAALNVAGGGLYGSPSVFTGRTAEFFMEAYYAGAYPNFVDPQATWRGPAPSVPHGLQWAGSVSAFGGGVDRSWLDDWFAGTPAPQSQGAQMAYYMTTTGLGLNDPKLWLCDDLELGPKRAVWNPAEETAYDVNMKDKTVHTVARFVFDCMALKDADALAIAKIDAATQFAINDPNTGLVAIKAGLDALKAQVAKITAGTQGATGPAGPPGPAVTSVTIAGTYPVK